MGGRARRSSIAIVGMSCRLPALPIPGPFGGCDRGPTGVGETPSERLSLSTRLFAEADLAQGIRYGAFLEGVDRFDADFFGVSPREAAAMDPQQRLALELAWEALEDAGVAPSAIRGEAGRGSSSAQIASDYASLIAIARCGAIGRHTVTGLHRSIIANRISYALGLGGPSLTVDAAQSSSLVAVHLACESLRRGESRRSRWPVACTSTSTRAEHSARRGSGRFRRTAAASPSTPAQTATSGGRAAASSCSSRSPRRRPHGDRIYCVVRGSAVNNDGGGAASRLPARRPRKLCARPADRRAGVERSEVQYVEPHGTGTPAGDPDRGGRAGRGAGRGSRPPAARCRSARRRPTSATSRARRESPG